MYFCFSLISNSLFYKKIVVDRSDFNFLIFSISYLIHYQLYLVQTPGKFGSAQPMPQLIIPARNHLQRRRRAFRIKVLLKLIATNLPSSLECTTKGPPESPCSRIIMLIIFLPSLTNPPDRNLCCHFRSPHT